MPLTQRPIKALVNDQLFPAFRKERERLDRIDKWLRWDHDAPHSPRHATQEYKKLGEHAQTPWGSLIVTSVAQALYVDDYRSQEGKSAQAWGWWQANRMDSRQIPIHRAALGYGLAYATVLPGRSEFGNEKMPAIRGVSPRRMITFYNEPEHDEYPRFALQGEPAKIKGSMGWALKVFDDSDIYYLNCDASGNELTYIESRSHGVGVCPVVRYANQLDLEGRTPGEIEPVIPMLSRIDQTEFDRLIVQRFASWVVRTISGMSRDETAKAMGLSPEQTSLMLRVQDLLVSPDKDTKFGALPATPLDGFLEAVKADIHKLAAVSQTPAHEMLGQLANLSAEALAAARASLTAKVEERRYGFGESHEQLLRLAAWVMGEKAAAMDRSAQVRWRDTEIRSLSQAADALGKMAQMLGIPVQALWERVPGATRQDVDAWKAMAEEGDALSNLTALLDRQADGNAA